MMNTTVPEPSGAFAKLAKQALMRPGRAPLNYFSIGAGVKTIAIVSAYAQSLEFWAPLVRQLLAHHVRVLLWQPRGTRFPDGGIEEPWPIEEHVCDMHALFQAEHIQRAHVLAWCSGAKTAVEFQAAYPAAVESLTLLAGSFVPDTQLARLYTRFEHAMAALCGMVTERPEVVHRLAETIRELMLAPQYAGPRGATEGDGESSTSRFGPLSEPIRSLLDPGGAQKSLVSYAHQLLSFWEHRIDPLLPRIGVPTLFIGGTADLITSDAMAREVAKRVPGAYYAEVRGGSHYMQYEAPHLIADLIIGFVRQGHAFEATGAEAVRVEHFFSSAKRDPADDGSFSYC